MTHIRRLRASPVMFVLTFFASVSIAYGQVYKCTDAAGRITYGDAPCSSAGKRLPLPADADGSLADATACVQLHDEIQRLSTEAKRSARRGRPADAASARRRQSLVVQYERRCAGIKRSGG